MFECVAVKDRAHFRAAQRQSEVAGLRCLDRVHGQSARFVGGAGKNFEIQTHEHGYNWRVYRNQAQTSRFPVKSKIQNRKSKMR